MEGDRNRNMNQAHVSAEMGDDVINIAHVSAEMQLQCNRVYCRQYSYVGIHKHPHRYNNVPRSNRRTCRDHLQAPPPLGRRAEQLDLSTPIKHRIASDDVGISNWSVRTMVSIKWRAEVARWLTDSQEREGTDGACAHPDAGGHGTGSISILSAYKCRWGSVVLYY